MEKKRIMLGIFLFMEILFIYMLLWFKRQFGTVNLEQLMFYAQMPVLESAPSVIWSFVRTVILGSMGMALLITFFPFIIRKKWKTYYQKVFLWDVLA